MLRFACITKRPQKPSPRHGNEVILMRVLRKGALVVTLALAFLAPAAGVAISANAAHTASAQPVASHIHVMADTTPDVTCGGGGSTNCK